MTITLSRLAAEGTVSTDVATTRIVIAAIANTLVKSGLAWVLGSSRLPAGRRRAGRRRRYRPGRAGGLMVPNHDARADGRWHARPPPGCEPRRLHHVHSRGTRTVNR